MDKWTDLPLDLGLQLLWMGNSLGNSGSFEPR